MVTPGNPLKDRGRLPPSTARVARRRPGRRPSAHRRDRISRATIGARYTVETLRYLAAALPGVRFVWIMGADSLASFHRWQGFARDRAR